MKTKDEVTAMSRIMNLLSVAAVAYFAGPAISIILFNLLIRKPAATGALVGFFVGRWSKGIA